jgi:hypothetical protein
MPCCNAWKTGFLMRLVRMQQHFRDFWQRLPGADPYKIVKNLVPQTLAASR